MACIVEQDAPPSLAVQELRLIFGNANTRVMSDADTAKQAARVEELLYKLKEDEGYEFPGRMRDHVSQVVGVSKSKLARLKVIREKLSHVWFTLFEKGKLNESVAYELAKLPEEWQKTIYDVRGGNSYLDVKYTKEFARRFRAVAELECNRKTGAVLCTNAACKMMHIASDSPYSEFHCGKCCGKCPKLADCKYVCPTHAAKAQSLRADKRAARKAEIAAEREADRPKVEKITAIWKRFGMERTSAGRSVKAVKKAMGSYYWSEEQTKYENLESGKAKITAGTKLPSGTNIEDVSRLIALADMFGCSLDYLLCRTDDPQPKTAEAVPESGTIWHPISEEPPAGVDLVWVDGQGYSDTGVYYGGQTIEANCTIQWPEARWWAMLPEE